MTSEQSEHVRNMTGVISREQLSQRQTTARQKVSKEAVPSTLKYFAETLSAVSKVQISKPKVATTLEDQYIKLCSLTDRKAA